MGDGRAGRSRARIAAAAGVAILCALASAARAGEDVVLSIADRDVTLRPERMLTAAGDAHAVVAFTRIPSDGDRARLAALGVTLHQYLPDHAWFATVPAKSGGALLALDFVRAAEPFRPEWKGPPGIVERPERLLWNLPDGRLLTHVYFFPDVPPQQARAALLAADALPLEEEFVVPARLRASIPPAAIPRLLADDRVRWMETGRWEARPANASAAAYHGVDTVAAGAYDLDGTGSRVGVMDVDAVQADHADFGNRVTIVETLGGGASDHATHVTGTVLGSGAGNSAARGMAPGAKAWTWPIDGPDLVGSKLAGFSKYELDVDNNSWGSYEGWELFPGAGWYYVVDGPGFSAYTAAVGDVDAGALAGGVLVAWAAGNARWDDGGADGFGYIVYCYPGGYDCGAFYGHWDWYIQTGATTFHDAFHPPDGGSIGFGNVDARASLKNGITVAALAEDGSIAPFSSAGPTKDGRMKPDCAAVGVDVLSCAPTDDYTTFQGTSMSTPVVSGLAALLVEAWRRGHGGDPPPLEVLKGLILHSCRDLGPTGPDMRFGFGAPQAVVAADLALAEGGSAPPRLRVGGVSQGVERRYLLDVPPGTEALRVTLCWIDPAGNPAAEKALVNDLDLRLLPPTGDPVLAWRPDADGPGSPALRIGNFRDTVEMVDVSSPAAGTWTAVVRGTTVPQSPQPFAIWSSAPRKNLPPVADGGGDRTLSGTTPTGAAVALSAATSTDPNDDDSIARVRWDTDGDGDFLDLGGSMLGVDVSAFLPMGTTAVGVQVTDAFGGIGVGTVNITVVNDPPVADLGPDRALPAQSPTGRRLALSTAQSSDPQGAADLVAAEWDLDGDGQYDDASGASVDVDLPPGTTDLGLRLRDTAGLASTDRAAVTVLVPEYALRLGGTFRGALDHSAGIDVDSFFFEGVPGTLVDLTVNRGPAMRITVLQPDGSFLLDVSHLEAGKSYRRKGLLLVQQGWHWLDLAPSEDPITTPYSLALKVRLPRVRGAAGGSLSASVRERFHDLPLVEGAVVRARLKGTAGQALSLVDGDGGSVASADGKGKLTAAAAASGVHRLRVSAPAEGGDGTYALSWKVSWPKGKVKLHE